MPPWKKGESGNPAGRKKGSKNKKNLFIQNISEEDKKYLLDRAVKKAKLGNDKMLKLLIDKILPAVPKLLHEIEEDKIDAEISLKRKMMQKMELEINLLEKAPHILTELEERIGKK